MEKQQYHSDFTCILKNGSPYINAKISGPLGVTEEHEFLVDTGFSDFVTIPAQTAANLRLPFYTFGSNKLADDRIVINVQCEGSITIDGETKPLLVTILPNTQSYAVGMGFLRLFSLWLTIKDQYFDLISKRELRQIDDKKKELTNSSTSRV